MRDKIIKEKLFGQFDFSIISIPILKIDGNERLINLVSCYAYRS